MQRKKLGFGSVLLVVVIILLGYRIAGLLTDYWWFESLSLDKIFLISLEARVLIFFISGLLFLGIMLLSLWISSRHAAKNIIPFRFKLAAALFLAYIVGSATSSGWLTVFEYFRQVPFSLADPVFSRDISFYVFSLPFYELIWRFAMSTVIFSTIFAILDYFQYMIAGMFKRRVDANIMEPPFDLRAELSKLKNTARIHISLLVSFIFLLLAVKHYLSQYSIMYSEQGIVVGAGYTDVYVVLPALKILIIAAVVAGIFVFIWMAFVKRKVKKRHVLVFIAGAYLAAIVLGTIAVPAIFQSLRVSPNEFNLEKPFIENNIRFTRKAYDLENVESRDFPAEKMTSGKINADPKTISNIRILDWRPLIATYKQTQEIRLYYDLSNIDVDRYMIDGKYRQVMVAPRELNQEQIAGNAKTWVNLHQVYTHGYGLVMSPVNMVTTQGLPEFFIQDIPPVYNVDEPSIRIERPQVYYGETDNTYVIVNTQTPEFDYPKGDTNQYTQYEGSGGVELSGFFRKLMMAIRFADIKILLSSDITESSRIMFRRDIQDRVSKIAPFLSLDQDPYMVLSQGKMYWIQDAYTTTGNYPYSQKINGINYIRNSVKIVIDAYEGSVNMYIADDDPIIRTFSGIFPGIFQPISAMPQGLKDHLRYPEDLFKVQSQIYLDYHMQDAGVFYNKEDAWQIPNEIYGTGQQVKVEPYYVIIRLPGEEKEEFLLMTSFTPIRKDNMVAWFAARIDAPNYGKMVLFQFPKDKLTYGPSQIEAKIDQDSEISQQLTLWSQQGSRVTRGNLLVIPIDDAILYVEPLYLQSEQGQLPELKRVIVSDGESVVMEETLAQSLDALFGRAPRETPVGQPEGTLTKRANELYEAILESMREGDWAGIGNNMDELGEVIKALEEQSEDNRNS